MGVRFGAYHIFVPALLKPAPSGLLATFWALKNGGLDIPGLADLSRLAASGRTSVPVDPAIARPLYRVVGYKVAGNRAVRIDILERLADLIRPLLSWRATAQQPEPPDGAVHGFGFTVTVAMTSLLGCSGEDFGSVLRSLGYRVDRRPARAKPALSEQPAATEAATAAGAAPADETIAAEPAPVEAVVEIDAIIEPEATEPALAPADTIEGTVDIIAVSETPAEHAVVAEPVAADTVVVEPSVVELVVTEAVAAEAVAAEAATAETPAAPVEPAMVEVWRPGRRAEDRPARPQRPARSPRAPRPDRAAQAASPAQPASQASPAAADAPRGDRMRPASGGNRDGNGPGRPARGPKPGRPPRSGQRSGQRPDRPDRPPRSAEVVRFSTEPPRNRQADPNSPFAALAALKAELEAKERGS
jgi:ATP-dependent RNA helicase SUPV3L1/SUV3